MSSEKQLNTHWNILDKFIAKMRYFQIDKYIKENGSIVDIGCGQEGTFLLSHRDRIKQGYGLDYKIKSHKVGNVTFINNFISKEIPIPKDSIDVCFLNAVLEHLQNPKDVLIEALGLLKKGGTIVMTTPTPLAKPILEFMAYTLHIINEAEIREHVHYYTRNDIEELVADLNKIVPCKMLEYKTFEIGLNSIIVIEKVE